MFAVVKLVVALCVVTRPRLARCQSREADPESHRADTQCGDGTLQMEVYSLWEWRLYDRSFDKNNNQFAVEYGTPFKLTCFGLPAPRLTLTKDGEKLLTENGTKWISAEENKVDLQNSVYVCSEVETGCQLSVVISGTPVLTVISDSNYYHDEIFLNYIIEYGNSVTVSCSAPNASRLIMTKDGEELITEKESETTIKFFHSKQDLQISTFVCTDIDSATNRSVLIRQVPQLYIQSRNKTITGFKQFETSQTLKTTVKIPYGDSIEVLCFGPKPVKLDGPTNDNNELGNVNVTKLKVIVRTFEAKESVFSCTDSDDHNYKSSVHVRAIPRMDVISPNVRRVGSKYAVKYGEPFEILCSWIEAVNLDIIIYEEKKEKKRKGEVQTINKTTIKYRNTFVNIFGFVKFECSTGYFDLSGYISVQLLPEAIDFRCVSYEQQSYLNCSWQSSSYGVKFTLFYIKNEHHTIVCTQQASRRINGIASCICDYSLVNKLLSFLMESCSDFGCYNETFLIDYASIIKLEPPLGLEVLKTSSVGTVLSWWDAAFLNKNDYLNVFDGGILYKVVYWYSGINPRELDTFQTSCDYYCQIQFTLPCPATYYEVKVYQKVETAIGEEYWSDPSTVTFVTDDDENKTDDIDSTCILKPHKNKEVMKYFVQELRQEVSIKMPDQKKESVPLMGKLALIRDLLKQLTEE